MYHNQYGTRLYVVRRHAVSYQCSHWLYGVQIGSRLLGDGSTGGALCQNWVQRGQSRFVWPDELALGIAGSCGESLWSIIYTVDMVIDTAWGDKCVYSALYVQRKGVYLGRVCVTEYMSAHVFHLQVYRYACQASWGISACTDTAVFHREPHFLFEGKQWDNGLCILLPPHLLWTHHLMHIGIMCPQFLPLLTNTKQGKHHTTCCDY